MRDALQPPRRAAHPAAGPARRWTRAGAVLGAGVLFVVPSVVSGRGSAAPAGPAGRPAAASPLRSATAPAADPAVAGRLQPKPSPQRASPVAASPAPASPAAATAPASAAAADAVGVYAGPGAVSTVASVGTLLGHHVAYAMDFLDGTSWSTISNPGWFTAKWAGSGYKMIWGVPILPGSGASLTTGATGAYDVYFKTLATRLVAQGQGSSIIRLGWEFNGSWFPWAADHHAAAFVAYWRQIVDTMRAVAGAHFQFEWNPTRGDLGVGPLSDYYPGNAYVDIVGLDVYDVEWASYPGPKAEWKRILTEPYGLDWLASFAAAQHKKIALPEWGLGWTSGGSVGGGDDPYFVEQMADWIAADHVSNAVAWDYGSNPLPSSAEPESRTAFAAAFSG